MVPSQALKHVQVLWGWCCIRERSMHARPSIEACAGSILGLLRRLSHAQQRRYGLKEGGEGGVERPPHEHGCLW